MSLEFKLGKLLKRKGMTLAMAESATGGLVSHRVTNVPGSSDYFLGSVVAYSDDVKTKVLKVPVALIKKHGAVSEPVARSMARGARRLFKSDIAASVTGIAGPSGGTRTKPVGLGYIAVASRSGITSRKIFFKGSRKTLKSRFEDSVLCALYSVLSRT